MIVVALAVAGPGARARHAAALIDRGHLVGDAADARVVVTDARPPFPAWPGRVLVVGPPDEAAVRAALRAGAAGYATPEADLDAAVRAVAAGRRHLSPDLLELAIAGYLRLVADPPR